MTYEGGCTCGAVAFEVEGEPAELMECNCSICKPKGYLHWFVPEDSFHLKTARAVLGEYTFNKHMLHHRFCTTCGVSPFVEGPGTVAVNARVLKDFDVAAVPVKAFDGASL
jgi:hypothetical protein